MRDNDLISLSLLIAARKQRYGQLLLELHVEENLHPRRKHTRELAGRAAEVKDELEFLHALQRQMLKGGDGDESAEPVCDCLNANTT